MFSSSNWRLASIRILLVGLSMILCKSRDGAIPGKRS